MTTHTRKQKPKIGHDMEAGIYASPPCWAVNGSAFNIGLITVCRHNGDSDETDVKSGAIYLQLNKVG